MSFNINNLTPNNLDWHRENLLCRTCNPYHD